MTHKAAIIGIGVPDVLLDVPFSPEKLSRYLADKVEAKQVSITDIYALSGGAIQENWSLLARFRIRTQPQPQPRGFLLSEQREKEH